jgi:hypothetical protein
MVFEQQLRCDTNYSSPYTISREGYSAISVPRNDFAYNYGQNTVAEQSFDISLSIPVGVTNLKLGFGSNLTKLPTLAAYGIDNVSVINASQNPGLLAPFHSSPDPDDINLDYIKSTASLDNRSLVSTTGTVQSVGSIGSIPSVANGYLASFGSVDFNEAKLKSQGLAVSVVDSANQSQSFKGFSRLAKLTNSAEIEAATTSAKDRSGSNPRNYFVDGYQATDSNIWVFDRELMSKYWGDTSVYLATPSGSWDQVRNNAIGYDGSLV